MAFSVKFTAPHDSELVLVLEHCFSRRADADYIADKINKQNSGILAWVEEAPEWNK